jgi:hypothetical protein
MIKKIQRLSVFAIFGLSLTACGGGGGGDGSSSASQGNSQNNSQSTLCAIANTHALTAVALNGTAGSAQFSGSGSVLTYSGALSGSLSLVKDSSAAAPLNAACLDASGSATSMRTAMQSSGPFGVSHTSVSGVDQAAFLIDSTALVSNSSVSVLQGTYTMLRYQNDTGTTPAQTRMSYVTFTIDSVGNWSMCKNAPTCSPATASGNFVATSGSSNSFDLASAGLVRAKAFLVGSGANTTLVVAEHDTGGVGVVTGIWFAVPQTTWNPAATSFVTNSSDAIEQALSLTASSISANGQSHAITGNSPVTGLASTTLSDGTVTYFLSGPAGLLVDGHNTANNFANGPAYLQFGIAP